jgi:hypothetical protein
VVAAADTEKELACCVWMYPQECIIHDFIVISYIDLGYEFTMHVAFAIGVEKATQKKLE